MTNSHDQLRQNCLSIVRELENESEDVAFTFLDDALSIEYTVDGRHQFLGAQLLVAFGGPTIWVDTRSDLIKGSWGGDKVTMPFRDVNDLHSLCEDLFDAGSRR